jgi:large subunit ribosomal protein L6
MSRIGKKPITIPAGVDVTIDGSHVAVKGPRGSLELDVHPDMSVVLEDGEVRVERPSDERLHRSLHGLTRTLVANMVEGVTNGYEKRLEIVGVGYRAVYKDPDIELALGFSHPVDVPAPPGIEFEVPAPNRIVIRGIDKQLVGQVAAEVRAYKSPEPYKGKGVRYLGEAIRKKAGKAAKGAA